MSELVALVHPMTGETLMYHPDVAAQKHHWIHPDPSVPTPAESLPLFDLREVDLLVASLTQPSLKLSIQQGTPEHQPSGQLQVNSA